MKPKYPKEILPCPNYKPKMEVDELLKKYPKLLVVRLVVGRLKDFCLSTQNGEEELSDVVFKNNMANLSMNLAGGLFKTGNDAHLRFLPATDEAAKPWNAKCIPTELYDSEECYNFYDACFGLCFYVSDIHNRTFPFYKTFNTKEERDEYEVKTIIAKTELGSSYDAKFVGEFKNKKTPVLVKPCIKVHHMPTMVNYWHMTLDTYRPIESHYVESYDKQKNSDKKMFKALKQDLLQRYKINESPCYSIESCDYISE